MTQGVLSIEVSLNFVQCFLPKSFPPKHCLMFCVFCKLPKIDYRLLKLLSSSILSWLISFFRLNYLNTDPFFIFISIIFDVTLTSAQIPIIPFIYIRAIFFGFKFSIVNLLTEYFLYYNSSCISQSFAYLVYILTLILSWYPQVM